MRIVPMCLMVISILLTTGCSWVTSPNEQPVIQERLNKNWFRDAKVGTLSLTPDRRVVLVNFTNDRFCAEAPTEVGLDLTRLIQLTAEASGAEESKAGFEAISSATSSNAVLNKRTQGMQLFLANAYFICQMYMNGAINEQVLLNLQLETLKAVEPLIMKELHLMYDPQALGKTSDNASGGQPSSSVDIDRIKKKIEPLLKDEMEKKVEPNE